MFLSSWVYIMRAKPKCQVVIGHAVLPVSLFLSTRSHQSQTCQISDGKCLHCTTAAGKDLWPTRKMAVHPFGSHVSLVFADCAQHLWVCSYLWVVNLQNIIVRKNVTNGNVRILHDTLTTWFFINNSLSTTIKHWNFLILRSNVKALGAENVI